MFLKVSGPETSKSHKNLMLNRNIMKRDEMEHNKNLLHMLIINTIVPNTPAFHDHVWSHVELFLQRFHSELVF